VTPATSRILIASNTSTNTAIAQANLTYDGNVLANYGGTNIIYADGSLTNGVLRMTVDSGLNYIQSATQLVGGSAAPLIFGAMYGSPEWARFNASGQLGIGTNAPAYKLDVSGTARITSNLGVGVTPLGTAGSINVSEGFYINGVKQLGPTGPQGNQGNQGVQGTQGNQGNQGVQGTQGNQGNQGVQGTQGNQGNQGVQGTQGNQGNQGVQGTQGNQGNQGVQGTQGNQGNQGNTGPTGPPGFIFMGDWVTGTTYQPTSVVIYDGITYLLNDLTSYYSTTPPPDDPTHWATLGGPGPTGGVTGSVPFSLIPTEDNTFTLGSADFRWKDIFLGPASIYLGNARISANEDGTIITRNAAGATAIFGPTGAQGPQGPQGNQGNAGTNGTNGAQGNQGPAGTNGTNGTNGTQGNQGSAGTNGAQGAQGNQGAGFSAITTPGTSRVLTANGSSTTSAIGQSNLTFNGTTLGVTGNETITTGTTVTKITSNLIVAVGSTGDDALYGIVQTVHHPDNAGGFSNLGQWSYSMIQNGTQIYGMGLVPATTGKIVIGMGANVTGSNGITIDTSNTRLGIGQTSPAYALDVTGTARVTGATTLGGILYMNNNNIEGIFGLYFQTSGNLNSFNTGGRNYLDLNGPSAISSVPGALRILGNGGGSLTFAENVDLNASTGQALTIAQSACNSYIQFQSNGFMGISSCNGINLENRGSNNFNIFNSGAGNLAVYGPTTQYVSLFQNGNNSVLQFQPGGNGLFQVRDSNYLTISQNGDGGSYFQLRDNGDAVARGRVGLLLETGSGSIYLQNNIIANATLNMCNNNISSAGNIQLNASCNITTSAGNTNARMFGSYYGSSPYNSDYFITNNLATFTSNATDILTATYDSTAYGPSAIRLQSLQGAGSSIRFYAGAPNTVPTNMMTIVPTRVGVACNDPQYTLDVNGTGNFMDSVSMRKALAFSNRSANPLNGQLTIVGPSQRLILGSYYTGGAGAASTIQASDFFDNLDHGTPLLLNPIGGDVGIGTNSPAYKLDVNGTARVTGVTMLGGTLNMCNNTISNVSNINSTTGIFFNGNTNLYDVAISRCFSISGRTGQDLGISPEAGYSLVLNGPTRVVGLTTLGNALEMGTAASWTSGRSNTLYGDTSSVGTKYIRWTYDNTPGTTIADGANMNLASPLVGINTTTPATTLDVNGGFTVRNGYRPLYQKWTAPGALEPPSSSYGTHYDIVTSAVTGLTIAYPGALASAWSNDSNGYWVFRNNTGTYLSLAITYSVAVPNIYPSNMIIPPGNSVTLMATYPGGGTNSNYVLF
jgi:hypothetical protein